jgi:hypothetical protein
VITEEGCDEATRKGGWEDNRMMNAVHGGASFVLFCVQTCFVVPSFAIARVQECCWTRLTDATDASSNLDTGQDACLKVKSYMSECTPRILALAGEIIHFGGSCHLRWVTYLALGCRRRYGFRQVDMPTSVSRAKSLCIRCFWCRVVIGANDMYETCLVSGCFRDSCSHNSSLCTSSLAPGTAGTSV